MSIQISLDRFEGKLAVLVTDEATQINIPRSMLPSGAKAGDVLTLDLTVDAEATRQLKADTRKLQQDLRKTDSGGDIQL